MAWVKIDELRGAPGVNSTDAAGDDAAIAAFVGQTSSATVISIAKKFGKAVNLENFPGVDPTAVTECATAIQAALDAASAAGVPLVSRIGQYKLATGVIIRDHADLSRAVFNYTGTSGVAVTVGNAPSSISRKVIWTPYLIALAKTVTGWGQVAGTVGVKVINTSDCEVHFGTVRNFETGIQFYGQGVGGGVTYCRFFLGTILNNKRLLHITTDNVSGYANQNIVFGGSFNFDAAEGAAVSGTRHVLIDNMLQAIDGWTFYGSSFEDSGAVAEFTIECYGNNNLFDACRFETYGGVPKVKWNAGSHDNHIRGGVNVDAIVETIVGATANKITRSTGLKVLTAVKTFNNTDEGKQLISNVAGGGSYVLPSVAVRSPGTMIKIKNINSTTISIATAVDQLDGSVSAQTIPQWGSKTFIAQQLPSAMWISV